MTFDDPGDGIFDHLDDPTPPLHGSDALTSVVQRGRSIRRRRQALYSAGGAAVLIAIGGVAIGVHADSSGGTQTVSTLHSALPGQSLLTPPPPQSSTSGPGGIVATEPGRHHSVPPVRVTATVTAATPSCDTGQPSATPSSGEGDSGAPSGAPASPPDGSPVSSPSPASPTAAPTPSASCGSSAASPSATPTDTSSPPAVTPTP